MIQVFYAGGDSDAVQAVYIAVSSLLVSSTIDVYTDSGNAAHPQSLNYLVISGVPKANYGGWPEIGFIYKYNGGGFPDGLTPLNTASNTLSYPSLVLLSMAVSKASAANAGPYPSSLNPDYTYVDRVNGHVQTPDWGITDEEQKLFNFPFNLNGANSNKPVVLSGIAAPLFVQPFGVAVTAALYNHKKSWSRAEVAAVLSGSVRQWSQLNDDSGNPLPVSLGQVTLIDSGSGSGTKAAGNSYFLDYPGGVFASGGAIAPNSVSVTLPGNTFPNGGYTGALNTAFPTSSTEIQDIKEASSAAEVNDLLAANAAGIGALAILGLEYPPASEQNSAGTNDYFFVAINGVYPDTETGADNINTAAATGRSTKYTNIINGSYDFAYQTRFNCHFCNLTPLSSFQADLYNNLASENISGAHTGLAFPLSAPGVLLNLSTTGHHDAGNLSWSRNYNSAGAPVFLAPVAAAVPDPF